MDSINDKGITGMSADEYRQQYSDTCAIKSQQVILNEFGIPVTKEELIKYSLDHGWDYGASTNYDNIGHLLEDSGVPVHHQENANVFDLVSELAKGHKVIAGVDTAALWGGRFQGWLEDFYGGECPDHPLFVSGIDTADPHKIMVNVADLGTDECYKSYPIDLFMEAWADSQCYMVATNIPSPGSLPEMVNFDYNNGHIDMVAGMDYYKFQVFHDLSGALPINTIVNGGYFSPMSSLMNAYFDVAHETVAFHGIFVDYEFNSYLNTDIANHLFMETYHSGLEYIHFPSDMTYEIYAYEHHIEVFQNGDYVSFLSESIEYFEAIGDGNSVMYCEQQMLILDYCNSYDIDFYETFYC